MKRICQAIVIVIFFLFLAPRLSAAQTIPGKDAVLFNKCQDYFYNEEYFAATICFPAYINLRPNDPLGYWRQVYSLMFLWNLQQSTGTPRLSEQQRDDFFRLAGEGIALADANIAAGKNVDFNEFIKASMLSMRAGIEYRLSRDKAGNSIRKGLAAAARSHYQDALAVTGFVNYELSDYRFWLKVLFSDLPCNRGTGIREIREASLNNNGPFADDIKLLLFHIATHPKDAKRFTDKERSSLFAVLFSRYPRNPYLKKYAALRH